MKLLLLFFIILLTACLTQNVISRNGKITEMINEITKDSEMYDQLIGTFEEKMNEDYENCRIEIKNQNCSEMEIWKQERSKDSKNITNLQQKIKTYNQTIDAILQLNKHEVVKQNLTMAKLFPKISKVKNDMELIENMKFLIEDTYLSLDQSGKSILLLFNNQFENPKAEQIQKQSFIQLISQKAKEAENTADKATKSPEDQNLQNVAELGPPLIDEEIFTGEVDGSEVEVSNLFAPTEEEKQFYADDIPESVNVKEHDSSEFERDLTRESNGKERDGLEDLRIYEVKEEFKNTIKELGKSMHEELETVHQKLEEELEQLTQSVADLEKAIIDLHHKHAKQIVQIYIETKKLQRIIFQLDDQILSLDARIFDCQKSTDKLEVCESRKANDQIVIQDLKTEKSFSEGILKELNKLLAFEDKNIYEPEVKIEQESKVKEEKTEEELLEEKNELMAKQRIKQIKEEEKIVEQEQLQQNSINNQRAINNNEAQQQTTIQKPLSENLKEEDRMLEEVENELKEEEEPELEEPEQVAETRREEVPTEEIKKEEVSQQNEEGEQLLQFLQKNKRK